jgi:hypothetical protein
LTDDYVEAEMRDRALRGVQFVAGLEKLPEASRIAVSGLLDQAAAFLDKTPALQSLADGEREEAKAKLLALLAPTKAYADGKDGYGLLQRMRTRILGALIRVPTAPFHLQVDASGAKLDLESKALEIIETGAIGQINGKARAFGERLAAIGSLKTFADTAEGEKVVERVKAALTIELAAVRNAVERENLRQLIAELK